LDLLSFVAKFLLSSGVGEICVPAVRPYWKGYIKLALVSCPIGLWAASSSSERVAFRQINKKTGNRLRQQLLDEETRIAVEAHDKGRGYEHAKGSYLMIEDHELEAIEIESNHTIEIDSFVPRAEIDERFLDSPYYVAPNEPVGQEAFAVIREAMRGKDMVALGRVVLSKRERVIMLQPWDKGLLGMTLRYPYELREAKDYFYDIPDMKVEPELLTLAQHILKTKEARFDPTKFVDRYEQAVLEMLKKKQDGLPAATVKAFAPPRAVPDLFEAFRQSLAAELEAANDETKPAKASKPKKPKAKVEGQREMLLPIAGGKAEAEATKPAKVSRPRRKAG
jgi:DNA end-binding protein Ku